MQFCNRRRLQALAARTGCNRFAAGWPTIFRIDHGPGGLFRIKISQDESRNSEALLARESFNRRTGEQEIKMSLRFARNSEVIDVPAQGRRQPTHGGLLHS